MSEEVGRHRAAAGPPVPWWRRPRSPLDSGLHGIYLMVLFMVAMVLWGGGFSVVSGDSVAVRLGGGAAVVVAGVASWLLVRYVRRPVRR